jgi:hypothetical protein
VDFRLKFRALSAHVLSMCVNSLMIVFIFRATGLDRATRIHDIAALQGCTRLPCCVDSVTSCISHLPTVQSQIPVINISSQYHKYCLTLSPRVTPNSGTFSTQRTQVSSALWVTLRRTSLPVRRLVAGGPNLSRPFDTSASLLKDLETPAFNQFRCKQNQGRLYLAVSRFPISHAILLMSEFP